MSPITHALTGWVVAQPMKSKKDRLIVTIAAVIPDIDGLTLLAGVESYQKYHHTFGHNIFVGLLISSLCLVLTKEKIKLSFLTFIAFHTHLICDLLGSGVDWGIYYFWPLSHMEFTSLPPFQWELDSWQNFTVTFLLIIASINIGVKQGRTIFEVFSTQLNETVVSVFRKWVRWFKKEKT